MRGKTASIRFTSVAGGITPAYAGKNLQGVVSAFTTLDHPRLCGEKSPVKINAFRNSGSPPPMRGKTAIVFANNIPIRITPAYAGKKFCYSW